MYHQHSTMATQQEKHHKEGKKVPLLTDELRRHGYLKIHLKDSGAFFRMVQWLRKENILVSSTGYANLKVADVDGLKKFMKEWGDKYYKVIHRATKRLEQSCNCITHGQKVCLNDFDCERCGVCMNWKGYEEGTIHCGC